MEQAMRNGYGKVTAAIFCFAMLLCSSLAQGQNGDTRCYWVDEPFHIGRYPERTEEIRSIKHCYATKIIPIDTLSLMSQCRSVGTVRTPEFSPRRTSWHWIMVQVEKPLPTKQIGCMMPVASDSPDSWRDCPLSDRLLRADWTVWEDGKIASNGLSTTHADDMYTKDNVFKFLGSFPALSGKKYLVEVKYIKDGTPLNVANPHLIVTTVGDE